MLKLTRHLPQPMMLKPRTIDMRTLRLLHGLLALVLLALLLIGPALLMH